MQVSLQTLSQDRLGIELMEIKANGQSYIAMQSSTRYSSRVKKAFELAKRYYHVAPDNFLEPISYKQAAVQGTMTTALFSNIPLFNLQKHLDRQSNLNEYILGKKAGWALLRLHQAPFNDFDSTKSSAHLRRCYTRFQSYINSKYRFINDDHIVKALDSRISSLNLNHAVLCYGNFNAEQMFLNKDNDIILAPSYAATIGDPYEDLAILTVDNLDSYPYFIAGCIDGYLCGKHNTSFYVRYAIFCGLYSLIRLNKKAAREMQNGSQLYYSYYQQKASDIWTEFNNFTSPVPKFLLSEKLIQIRNTVYEKGL